MLGDHGRTFECGHEHAVGDRCIAFRFGPEFFEQLAADLNAKPAFRAISLPPLRALAPLSARATAGVLDDYNTSWDKLALDLASTALQLANGASKPFGMSPRGYRASEPRPRESAKSS